MIPNIYRTLLCPGSVTGVFQVLSHVYLMFSKCYVLQHVKCYTSQQCKLVPFYLLVGNAKHWLHL